jgi:hypothetical protein
LVDAYHAGNMAMQDLMGSFLVTLGSLIDESLPAF